jgi:hypothetical protein
MDWFFGKKFESPVKALIRDLEQNPELITEFEQALVDAKKKLANKQLSRISETITGANSDAKSTFIGIMNQILHTDTELKSTVREIRNSLAQSINMLDASGNSQYTGVVFRMNLSTLNIDICLLPAGTKPDTCGLFKCYLVKYPEQRIKPQMFLYQNGSLWLQSVYIDQPTSVSLYTKNESMDNDYFYMLLNSSLFSKLDPRLNMGF